MRVSLVLSSLFVGLASCAPDVIAVEVLPPRSGTCAAPSLKAPALGRGLFDLEATRESHGAYVADLRISSSSDAIIDGVRFGYVLPEGTSSAQSAADDAARDAPALGDVVLDGSDEEELRRAIVEDVVLIPRALAIALRDDEDLSADETTFATLTVELDVIVAEEGEEATDGDGRTPSSFAVDLCRGCLAVEPSEEECPDGVVEQPVCRPGQEDEMFACATPAAAVQP